MRIDVIDFRDFYATRRGRMVKRVVRSKIKEIWPDIRGETLLGLGYASPFLSMYQGKAGRIINMMAAGQGVMRWPLSQANQTALVEETHLPMPDASVDRFLLCHGLENSETVRPLLREIWRVLSASGRLLIVTPNRRGLWARFDSTPFGHGRPYSRGQLTQLMRESQFTPTYWGRTLYTPPFEFDVLVSSASAWENMGEKVWPQFSGLLLLEASKQIYAVSADRPKLRILSPVALPKPAVNLVKRDKSELK